MDNNKLIELGVGIVASIVVAFGGAFAIYAAIVQARTAKIQLEIEKAKGNLDSIPTVRKTPSLFNLFLRAWQLQPLLTTCVVGVFIGQWLMAITSTTISPLLFLGFLYTVPFVLVGGYVLLEEVADDEIAKRKQTKELEELRLREKQQEIANQENLDNLLARLAAGDPSLVVMPKKK